MFKKSVKILTVLILTLEARSNKVCKFMLYMTCEINFATSWSYRFAVKILLATE